MSRRNNEIVLYPYSYEPNQTWDQFITNLVSELGTDKLEIVCRERTDLYRRRGRGRGRRRFGLFNSEDEKEEKTAHRGLTFDDIFPIVNGEGEPEFGPEISEEMKQKLHRENLERRAEYHNNKLKLLNNPDDEEARQKMKEYEQRMGWTFARRQSEDEKSKTQKF